MKTETPVTPLPITTACDEEFRANSEDGRKYRAEQALQLIQSMFCAHDWVYESTRESEADTSGWTRGARRCKKCDEYENLMKQLEKSA